MSEVLVLPNYLEDAFAANAYFADIDWLQAFRARELSRFIQRGFPTTREEHWKYTDIKSIKNTLFTWPAPLTCEGSAKLQALVDASRLPREVLLVFVNGRYSRQLSDLTLIPKDLVLCPLSQAILTHESMLKPHLLREFDNKRHPFASLNSALMTDGFFIQVPKNVSVKTPIHCLFISTEKEVIACPRNLIIAEENSDVSVIEEYIAATSENYFNNIVTEIHADTNATITHHKIQNESDNAVHIANYFVEQKQHSRVNTHLIATGSKIAREDLNVNLNDRGAECSLNGIYCLSQDGQVQDNHLHVNHAKAHGVSDMFYKGILDKKSRGVFNGKVYVEKDAQQTNAHQANHSLLMSPTAEMNTKPELEIYADDVKCAHGATIGQLDEESLFYLRSRGLDQAQAKKLLTYAFTSDVMSRVADLDIQAKMTNVLNAKLSQMQVTHE